MQGAQILRNETYLLVRRNDEAYSATPQMDFLRSHHFCLFKDFNFVEMKLFTCPSGWIF